jgi:hypothetical protein
LLNSWQRYGFNLNEPNFLQEKVRNETFDEVIYYKWQSFGRYFRDEKRWKPVPPPLFVGIKLTFTSGSISCRS